IEVISIVDNLLEHSRIYIFGNDDNPEIYISSADWMTRNIDDRVEVSCPIYDEEVKQQLLDIFANYWQENVKARIYDKTLANRYRLIEGEKYRAQFEMYKYYENQLEVELS